MYLVDAEITHNFLLEKDDGKYDTNRDKAKAMILVDIRDKMNNETHQFESVIYDTVAITKDLIKQYALECLSKVQDKVIH